MKEVCSYCGRSFKEISQTGFVGCEHCYREIDQLTKRVSELFDGKKHCGRKIRRRYD